MKYLIISSILFSSCSHYKKVYSIEELIFNKRYKQGLAQAQTSDLESQAWTLGKLNHYLEAKDTYDKINHENPDKETKAKACFFAGFLVYEKGLYNLARKSWQKCLNNMLDTIYYENYLWHEALLAILEEDYILGKKYIKMLKNKFFNSVEYRKYLYFYAYILNKLNKKEKAVTVWRNLSKNNIDYYSLLSKQTLKLDIKLDLPLLPKPYVEIIRDSANKWQVLPSLIYAIMKTESSFNKDAISKRGAIGLMQVMPEVGSLLSLNIKDKFSKQDLRDPKKSIYLSSLLLALLKEQFGHYYLAIAAYNAGADKVQVWQNLFGHLPIELFIEHIPFKETRNYLKSVLASESIYYALSNNMLRLLI